MNQEAIGKFIATCRKERGFTQVQLAEKLNITNRAVSKWETGKSCPDASIMLELCKILEITVNELLSGESLSMVDYQKKAEENLVELQEKKTKVNSWWIRYLCSLFLMAWKESMPISSFNRSIHWERHSNCGNCILSNSSV